MQHIAKEILALAVTELFPGAHLIAGEAGASVFSYTFHFPTAIAERIGDEELGRIEDQMRLISAEKRPIEMVEMMREVAQNFFKHHKQPLLAEEVGEYPYNVIPLIKIGQFHAPCVPPYPETTGEVRFFHLFEAESLGEGVLRISGAAFETRDEEKQFRKGLKEVRKRDPRVLGPQRELFFFSEQGELLLLPGGERIDHHLRKVWREEHVKQNFSLVTQPIEEILFERQKKQKPYRVGYLQDDFDRAIIFCEKKNLKDEVILSLQFFQRMLKIFGFASRIVCSCATENVLTEALEACALSFRREKGSPSIEFRLIDGYGREGNGPTLWLREEGIVRSLFGSIERWIYLLASNQELEFAD